MSTTYTTNYHLGKQEDTNDYFSMEVITDDMDIIDSVLYNKADKSTTYTKTEVDTALSEKGADLVSGLQTELSASNKLNPAYIDYDSTHRAVSDTEKAAWNSKQSALTAEQLAAVNSGIDSTKVAQIETNKNNISMALPYPDDILSESQVDDLPMGALCVSPSVSVAGYSSGSWLVIHTYDMNAAKSRRMQVIESSDGTRKTRFKGSGGWGKWG